MFDNMEIQPGSPGSEKNMITAAKHQEYATAGKGPLGFSLIKRKASAIQSHFRTLINKIIRTKTLMNELSNEASLTLSHPGLGSPEFKRQILGQVTLAKSKVNSRMDNIIGVNSPVFDASFEENENAQLDDSGGGGNKEELQRQIQANYKKQLKLMIDLASLQSSAESLDKAIQVTNGHLDAIDHERGLELDHHDLPDLVTTSLDKRQLSSVPRSNALPIPGVHSSIRRHSISYTEVITESIGQELRAIGDILDRTSVSSSGGSSSQGSYYRRRSRSLSMSVIDYFKS